MAKSVFYDNLNREEFIEALKELVSNSDDLSSQMKTGIDDQLVKLNSSEAFSTSVNSFFYALQHKKFTPVCWFDSEKSTGASFRIVSKLVPVVGKDGKEVLDEKGKPKMDFKDILKGFSVNRYKTVKHALEDSNLFQIGDTETIERVAKTLEEVGYCGPVKTKYEEKVFAWNKDIHCLFSANKSVLEKRAKNIEEKGVVFKGQSLELKREGNEKAFDQFLFNVKNFLPHEIKPGTFVIYDPQYSSVSSVWDEGFVRACKEAKVTNRNFLRVDDQQPSVRQAEETKVETKKSRTAKVEQQAPEAEVKSVRSPRRL